MVVAWSTLTSGRVGDGDAEVGKVVNQTVELASIEREEAWGATARTLE
jgi:hypothetical protein